MVVQDLVADLLYYDRKEDEDLKLGEIEEAIRLGTFSTDDIASWFGSELTTRLTENNACEPQ